MVHDYQNLLMICGKTLKAFRYYRTKFIRFGFQGFLNAIYQSYRDIVHIHVDLNVRLRLVALELYAREAYVLPYLHTQIMEFK